MEKLPKMKFTAVGDMLIQRVISTEYEGFQEVSDYIRRGDARFFNFESIIYREGIWGSQFNGGSYHYSDPRTLEIAAQYGFNMMSFANNHTLDWSYGGLISTLDALKNTHFVHAGVGMNLDEAAAPAYLDTPNGRVALISMASSIADPSAMAGRQSNRTPGRPGVNALRTNQYMEVTPEQMDMLRQMAKISGINAARDISRAEGYTPLAEENSLDFGGRITFRVGDKTVFHKELLEADMRRLEQAVYEAKHQADYILVSVHSHEISGASKENPADFIVEFAHRCIDLGVHAVLGHGPHLLRPLEIYKKRPIFYSLGDFMLHNESVTFAPEDMFEKYGMTSGDPVCDIYRKRSRNYTVGLLTDRRMMEAVIPYFEMENGELSRLELLPIELGYGEPRYRLGNPRVRTDRGIIERYAQMSALYGTEMIVNEQGIGVVTLK